MNDVTDLNPEGPKRCGLMAIVGRPNVGKSTLLNALVGQKISITSRKAQTTRHRITGMRTEGDTQFIFVDTPGFQTRHTNALNRSLNKTVLGAVSDVDLVLFVVEAGQFSMADAKVLSLLRADTPVLLVANKLDAAIASLSSALAAATLPPAQTALQMGIAAKGDPIVLLAGRPLGQAKRTNTLAIHRVTPSAQATPWPGMYGTSSSNGIAASRHHSLSFPWTATNQRGFHDGSRQQLSCVQPR